jgi:predicted phosphodiesterase
VRHRIGIAGRLPHQVSIATQTFVPSKLTRIFSDIHYGDQASRVDQLHQLRPLLDGVTHLVLNGDTLDTRPGPFPDHTARCRSAVADFFPAEVAQVTFLTGNHDADFSPQHHLDLADEKVFVTHGDIFFDDIVPWSKDAKLISRRIAAELHAVPPELHHHLDHRLAVLRRVAASIPQRHQSEQNTLKYVLHYIADTLWPPLRTFRVLHAWRMTPIRAAALAKRHRPAARFILSGHTHRPGIWQMSPELTVINTGSFCPPFGGTVVDLEPGKVTVRRVDFRAGEFRAGSVVAEFPLADT